MFFPEELQDNDNMVISGVFRISIIISVILTIMVHNSLTLIPSLTFVFQPLIFSLTWEK